MSQTLEMSYEKMDVKRLTSIIEAQEKELVIASEIIKTYQKHLVDVIEYHSIEKYRSTVQKNRESDMNVISEYTTRELHEELVNREGVTNVSIGPEDVAELKMGPSIQVIDGPAQIIINRD